MFKSPILRSALLASTLLFVATLPAPSQTAIVVSGYGTLNGTTTGNYYTTEQTPANQAGGLIELQHLSGPFLGFEATYSYNRTDTTYSNRYPSANVQGSTSASDCPIAYGCPTATVSANAHESTVDWTPSRLIFKQRMLLFGVLGAGVLADVPSSSKATVVTAYPCGLPVNGVFVCGNPGAPPATVASTSETRASVEPVYVYGAGLDWGLLPHLGIRL